MLLNKTSGKRIAGSFEVCSSFFSKAKGLMFSRKSRLYDNALIFPFDKPRKYSFHMMFVFYPIDIVFLDQSGKVVDVVENFRPFTSCSSTIPCSYVLEISAGKISSIPINVGDVISW